MKSNTLHTLASLVLIAVLSPLGQAFAGTGSSNGDGDRAFALQKLAAANPKMSPDQVLLKAFTESAGQIPTLKFETSRTAQVVAGRMEEVAPDGLSPLIGVEFFALNSDEIKPYRVDNLLRFAKQISDLGPLFPRGDDIILFSGAQALRGTVHVTGGSLQLKVTTGANNGLWMELRAYTPTIVIFVVRPTDKGCTPLAMTNNLNFISVPAKSNVCSVGYFWRN